MHKSRTDVWVGLFVMLGAAALLFLALQSANLLQLDFRSGYRVTARFDNIGGLKPKAAVRSAGVVVGRVESITFDDKIYQARVTLALQDRYAFPKDSSVKILTSGLLGEQYLGIEAGADDCQSGDDGHELFCAPEALHEVARALEAKFGEPRSANMIWKPQNLIAVDDEKAETLIKMLEALDDDDDVQQVYANFEVSDSVMEKMSA